MIQVFATMAVLLELISFILLAYYYLAPSQSKAAKAKSMLALNRARSTATLGGAGINGHPGSTSGPASTSGRGFSKSVASLATTTGGASHLSLRNISHYNLCNDGFLHLTQLLLLNGTPSKAASSSGKFL